MVGALVRRAVDGDRPLAELVAAEPRLGAGGCRPPRTRAPSVAQRTTPGAGGPAPLAAQLDAMRSRLDRQAQWLA